MVEFGPRYSTCPNKDLVGVISLIKGLTGGQVGANNWSRGNRVNSYEVGLGQGQALGLDFFKHEHHTTYIQQTVLLNTPLEREFAFEALWQAMF